MHIGKSFANKPIIKSFLYNNIVHKDAEIFSYVLERRDYLEIRKHNYIQLYMKFISLYVLVSRPPDSHFEP